MNVSKTQNGVRYHTHLSFILTVVTLTGKQMKPKVSIEILIFLKHEMLESKFQLPNCGVQTGHQYTKIALQLHGCKF